jgi:cell division protein FtsL
MKQMNSKIKSINESIDSIKKINEDLGLTLNDLKAMVDTLNPSRQGAIVRANKEAGDVLDFTRNYFNKDYRDSNLIDSDIDDQLMPSIYNQVKPIYETMLKNSVLPPGLSNTNFKALKGYEVDDAQNRMYVMDKNKQMSIGLKFSNQKFDKLEKMVLFKFAGATLTNLNAFYNEINSDLNKFGVKKITFSNNKYVTIEF